MAPIKDLNLSYEALNERGTFSAGDTLAGTLSFTLTKETKIKSLFVKAKGEARVHWTEGSGDDETSYSAHRRYFKLKELLIEENAKGTVLSQGIHRFKFRFKIPEGHLPPSFRGLHGWIAYTLEAKVSRSWRWPSRVKQEIDFVSKSIPQHDNVMCPQSGSVSKETGVFSKGQIQLSATVDRRFCSPGDTLSAVAKICNSSSKTMRPKFNLQQVTVYRAGSATNSSTKSLCKAVGETIASNSEESVSCQLQLPVDAVHTLYSCEIISIDYYLKVYLDISFAIDPEVVFPLIVIPSYLLRPPYPGGAAGGPSCSDFPAEPYPAHGGPGAYGYQAPGIYPQMDSGGRSSQWPQQANPNSFPPAAFTPPSLLGPSSAAPPPFQQGGEPPSYTSLFPHS
ncbi:arrestin domain-containing protein 3-like [Betta splendens]|uniref:Arrestin domain-containing protein 3-like n=1 Tax=Betta splendens TaxID=158456 RepID=A0A6P7NPI5_BETSP|nr:arrestin domain-containing protein 3-like [Betta splendens]